MTDDAGYLILHEMRELRAMLESYAAVTVISLDGGYTQTSLLAAMNEWRAREV